MDRISDTTPSPPDGARRGASGLTYGLLLGLLSVAAIGAVTGTGSRVNVLFGGVAQRLAGIRPVPQATAAPVAPGYGFTSHTFTTCGITGRTGPTLANCRSAYGASGFWQDSAIYGVTGGIQTWVVPATGLYQITAIGAGNDQTCQPAQAQVTTPLTGGETLRILVGQRGQTPAAGGGSFVVRSDDTPIAIGGGVGGRGSTTHCNASLTGTGRTADGAESNPGGSSGQGAAGSSIYASGGGGLLTSGGQGGYNADAPGAGFRQGGAGGDGVSDGGFGGGASGGTGGHYGGGGGYSGGGASGNGGSGSSGGGGSFVLSGGSITAAPSGNEGSVTIIRQ